MLVRRLGARTLEQDEHVRTYQKHFYMLLKIYLLRFSCGLALHGLVLQKALVNGYTHMKISILNGTWPIPPSISDKQEVKHGMQALFFTCHYPSTSTSSSSVPSLSMKPLRRFSLTNVAPPRSIPGPPICCFCKTNRACASRASCSCVIFGGRPRPRDAVAWP